MSELYSDSIFWIEVEKIRPNPYQPRREFDEKKLDDLAESIRQYGVLQPLVVTRHEVEKPSGGIAVEYELIAGERRLRASKRAGVAQVPAIIRTGEQDDKMKLELAIIENLQREDLNPVDRAKAFQRFIDEFGFKHTQIAKKVGKSREYVSNSLRLLLLPEEILTALSNERISEGHARALMMLKERPDEQNTVFKEVMFKKLTVRETEGIARRIAKDKVRKKEREYDPEIVRMEEELTEKLGTRVQIEARNVGGKITIDFFSDEDLRKLLVYMNEGTEGMTEKPTNIMEQIAASTPVVTAATKEEQEDENAPMTENVSTHVEDVPELLVSPKPTKAEDVDDAQAQPAAATTTDASEQNEKNEPSSIEHRDDIQENTQRGVPVDAVETPVSFASEVAEEIETPESFKETLSKESDPFDALIEAGMDESDVPMKRDLPETKESDDDIYSVKNFSV